MLDEFRGNVCLTGAKFMNMYVTWANSASQQTLSVFQINLLQQHFYSNNNLLCSTYIFTLLQFQFYFIIFHSTIVISSMTFKFVV